MDKLIILIYLSFSSYRYVNGNTLWWNLAEDQGPNVCVIEDLPGKNYKLWTECKYWIPREICGNKPLIKYACCNGYKRINDKGCSGVKPLKNILQTAKNLGANKFVELLEKSGVKEVFSKNEPITLFAPSDDAFRNLNLDEKIKMENLDQEQLNSIILYHTVNGRVTLSDLKAESYLETKSSNQKVLINKFSTKIDTINCAMIVRKDHQAINGVVHIINSILDPSISFNKNIADVLIEDGRFNTYVRAMEQVGIGAYLRRLERPVTVLAPSDEAFQSIPKSTFMKIMQNSEIKEEIVKHHILPHSICSPALIKNHTLQTKSDNKISMNCDEFGVKIEGERLISNFILTENGIIYMIENVLLPNKVKTIIQLLEERELFTFLRLVQIAKLEDTLSNMRDYTLFAPTESAMFSLPHSMLQELKSNQYIATQFVLHHIIPERKYTSNFANNELILTLDKEYPLRLQAYRDKFGVDGSLIQDSDIESLNGLLNVITKPLKLIKHNIHDLLDNNVTYSQFLQALDKYLLTEPNLLDEDKPKTIFVPTDQAFYRLGQHRINKLMSDSNLLKKVIGNHIVDNVIPMESLSVGLQYIFETRNDEIIINKDDDGNIQVNDAKVLEYDLLNKNGILHIINQVLVRDSHLHT